MSETTAAPAPSAPESTSEARAPRWERGLAPEPAREQQGDHQSEGTDPAAIEAALEGADHTGEGTEEGDEHEERESTGTHRVKVDGEEFDVSTEELIAGYSRNRASQKRFQEAAELKTQVQRFVGELRGGKPEVIESLLRKVGVDPVDVAEKILRSALEEANLPEAERGMRALKREREGLQRERERWEAQQSDRAVQSEAQTLQRQYTQEVTSGLQGAGLPVSQGMIARVAAEMEAAIKGGYDLDTAGAVALVREDMHGMAKRLSTETLAKITGSKETAEALKRAVAGEVHAVQRREAAKPATARRAPRQPATPPPVVNPESPRGLKALFDS